MKWVLKELKKVNIVQRVNIVNFFLKLLIRHSSKQAHMLDGEPELDQISGLQLKKTGNS